MMRALVTAYDSYEEDYTLPGAPMDTENYKTRIQKVRERVEAGYYTTQEDMEKEMEQW